MYFTVWYSLLLKKLPGPIPIYLNITDYIPCAVLYISVAILELPIYPS